MSMLMIQNDGEVDINALLLVGASTKEGDDTKIGFFGSGNKYAIACLLRNHISFIIYAGLRRMEVTTEQVTLRDQQFDRVCIDGQPTSLTTRMGPQWTPWMALREFACNAIDEGGYVIEETDSENPEAGFTKVYINMLPAVEDFWKYRQKYLETEKPYQTINVPDGDIVHFHNHNTEGKPGKRVIYRKGVRCSPLEDSQQSLFRYDIPALKIGENRLFESEWTMSRTIAEAYYACSDLDILKKLLKIATDKSYFEGNISWPNSGYHMDTAWEVLLMDEKIISQAHCPFLPPEDIRSGFVV